MTCSVLKSMYHHCGDTRGGRCPKATKDIPIVSLNLGDPVATGLVQSLGRPGGNITGFTPLSVELTGKRLALLKETFPKVSRVTVLFSLKPPAQRHGTRHGKKPSESHFDWAWSSDPSRSTLLANWTAHSKRSSNRALTRSP